MNLVLFLMECSVSDVKPSGVIEQQLLSMCVCVCEREKTKRQVCCIGKIKGSVEVKSFPVGLTQTAIYPRMSDTSVFQWKTKPAYKLKLLLQC